MGGRILGYVRRHHLALIALFIALGGTSVAATQLVIPRNSVGTKQLKNGAVTKKKIARKTLTGLKGARGPTGAQGAPGTTGTKGATGPAGPGAVRIDYDRVSINDATTFEIPVLDMGDLKLTAGCLPYSGGVPWPWIGAKSSVTPSDIHGGYTVFDNSAGTTTPYQFHIAPNSTNQNLFNFPSAAGNNFSSVEGHMVYYNANREISIFFHGVANNATNRCQFTGSAYPATGGLKVRG